MKIAEVTAEHIKFNNGFTITYDHVQDCCENNYADFEQLDDIAKSYNFDEDLVFEAVPNSGFRFGNKSAMFFVPCYSEQNGYYSSEISIYYNRVRNLVLSFEAEEKTY